MGGSKKQTIGYRYFLGLQWVLCKGPIDALTQILIDGKSAYSGVNTGGPLTIASPDLFGGEKREGGVVGVVDFCPGGPAQGVNSYLASRMDPGAPAFRGLATLVFNQVYLGMNPYLKRQAFRAERIHLRQDGLEQWYDAKAEISTGGDYPSMNPAHIIRECLTDPDWGMAYNDEDIDDDSFMAAADTLYGEGMGMSVLWDQQIRIEEFVVEMLRHIDGSVIISPSTGKFQLILIRDDYDVGDLLVLDESSIEKVTDFRRAKFGELTTAVTVTYTDDETGKKASVSVQDIALEQAQSNSVGTTIEYRGFKTIELATRAAQRDLRTLSSELASCTVTAKSVARSLYVGAPFVMDWPDHGLEGTVMRVTGIDKGDGLNSLVRITCSEDVFRLDETALVSTEAGSFVDPQSPPEPLTLRLAFEMPYLALVQERGQADVDTALATTAEAGFVGITAVRVGSAINATMQTDAGTGYVEVDTLDFGPYAELDQDLELLDDTFAITAGVDISNVALGSWCQIGDELMRVDAISDSSLTVGRGCLDTIPAEHTAGDTIFFWAEFAAYDPTQYLDGESVDVKLLTVTGSGILDEADAPVDTVTLVGRGARPYAPGLFAVNDEFFPEYTEGEITVSWSHRDRLQQTAGVIYDFTAGDIGPEPGTTYTVRISSPFGLERTETGITGTSYTYADADEASDGGPFKVLTFELFSVRDGLESFQSYLTVVKRENPRVTEYSDRLKTEEGDQRVCE